MSTLSVLPEVLPEALALPAPAALTELRRIRVSYASRFHDGVSLAALTLRGKWLEEAGFPTGTDADVRVMPGCIVITARAGAGRSAAVEIPAPRLQAVGAQATTGAGVHRGHRRQA